MHPVRGLDSDAAIERHDGGRERLRIERQQRCVVVQHLLEMRDRPFAIDAVTKEPAAELVVEAGERHPIERVHDDREHLLGGRDAVCVGRAAAEPLRLHEQQLERRRVGKLRRAAEAAVLAVMARGEPLHRALDRRARQRCEIVRAASRDLLEARPRASRRAPESRRGSCGSSWRRPRAPRGMRAFRNGDPSENTCPCRTARGRPG